MAAILSVSFLVPINIKLMVSCEKPRRDPREAGIAVVKNWFSNTLSEMEDYFCISGGVITILSCLIENHFIKLDPIIMSSW